MVRTHHEDGEPLPSRLPANRFHKIGAGRASDPRSQKTAQHHNRKTIRCYKSSASIGFTEVRMLLQLHDVIKIKRADAEIIAVLLSFTYR